MGEKLQFCAVMEQFLDEFSCILTFHTLENPHIKKFMITQMKFLAALAAQELRKSQTNSQTNSQTHKQTHKLTLSNM